MTRDREGIEDSVRRVGREWETLAGIDPLWAILSDPAKRGNRWEPEAFFESGRGTVEALLARVEALGVTVKKKAALDFGCGAGRLTQALAGHFERAVGIDISPTMIRLANEHNRHGERCAYVLNETAGLEVLGEPRFDFVLSLIVLQHMPPEMAREYLGAMAARLSAGGVLVFQLPSEKLEQAPRPWWKRGVRLVTPASWRFAIRRMLGDRTAGLMQMHTTPRREVEALLDELGLERVSAERDGCAGPAYGSVLYIARKL